MLKLSYEEFIEEIKAEMQGYEEIEETAISQWFSTLEDFVAKKKKSTIFHYKGSEVEVELKDEADLFMIVDRFLAALVNEEIEKYYADWSL